MTQLGQMRTLRPMTSITAAAVVPSWTLTDRLRKARDHAHLTQAQLANKLQVSEKTIKRYEAGAKPQLRTLVAWAWFTGVDVRWLLRDGSDNEGGPGADNRPVTLGEPPELVSAQALHDIAA